MNTIKTIALATLVAMPGQAFATDWIATVKVTAVEVSYGPNAVDFTIDQDVGSCPTGGLLWWNSQGSDNVSKASSYAAMLSALLTAKSTGQSVVLFGNNSGCTVTNAYLK